MAPRKFPRFLDLPKEIQLQIWSLAATPKGPIQMPLEFLWDTTSTNAYFAEYRAWQALIAAPKPPFQAPPLAFKQVFHCLAPKKFANYGQPRYGDTSRPRVNGEKARFRVTAATRKGLMGACRLAREVVLKTWMEDFVKIALRPGMEKDEHTLEELVEMFDGLLKDLVRGDAVVKRA